MNKNEEADVGAANAKDKEEGKLKGILENYETKMVGDDAGKLNGTQR